ncbi:MAG: 50S ribosomal protein L9 [Alkalispirochaeta sp.]
MKVILNADVANLGEEGDICTVAPGYARNYLLPKGLVLEDNARNREMLEARRADIEARKAEKRRQAASIKDQIEQEPLVVRMTAGTNGKLFGSVSAATIVEQLAARGIEVERKKIEVPENSIKTTGNFKVRVRLYGDEEAVLSVSVEASNAREIEAQKAKEGTVRSEAASAPEEAEGEDQEVSADASGPAEEIPESSQSPTATESDLDPEVMAMQAAEEADKAEKEEE